MERLAVGLDRAGTLSIDVAGGEVRRDAGLHGGEITPFGSRFSVHHTLHSARPWTLRWCDGVKPISAASTRLGAEILSTCEVLELTAADSYRGVRLTDGSDLRCYSVLIATGVEYRRLEQPGVAELTGAGIYYGAAMIEGQSIKGEDVFIAGGANSAGQAALYFAQFANSVTFLVRGNSLTKSMAHYLVERIQATENIRVMLNTQIAEANGSGHLETLKLLHSDTGQEETVDANALFIFIGAKPATAWLGDLVARDKHGFVLAGHDLETVENAWPLLRQPFLLETSLPGVYVSGDVRSGNTKRVVTAVNEGAMAVNFVQERLNELGA